MEFCAAGIKNEADLSDLIQKDFQNVVSGEKNARSGSIHKAGKFTENTKMQNTL